MPHNDISHDSPSPEQREGAVTERFEWAETTPTAAVARVFSAVADSDPTRSQPLYDALDPTALNDLLAESGRGVSVSFTHQGVSVVVRGDGTVIADPD